MGFSRQEYWSGLSFPSPGDLPDPGIGLKSLESPAMVGGFFTTLPPGKPSYMCIYENIYIRLALYDLHPTHLGHHRATS